MNIHDNKKAWTGKNHFLEMSGNQKSSTPKPEMPLKNEKSRTLNIEVISPSGKGMVEGAVYSRRKNIPLYKSFGY